MLGEFAQIGIDLATAPIQHAPRVEMHRQCNQNGECRTRTAPDRPARDVDGAKAQSKGKGYPASTLELERGEQFLGLYLVSGNLSLEGIEGIELAFRSRKAKQFHGKFVTGLVG